MTFNKSDVMFDLDTMARVIQALTAAKKEIEELKAINEKLGKQLAEKTGARQTPSFIGQWVVSNPVVTYARLFTSFEPAKQAKPIPAPNVEGTATVQ